MAQVSIKNIAQALGISNATVSLVLNGKEKDGRVSKEMSEKIRLKAKELGYRPNSLAKSLRIGRSQTIGVIVADISNSFFASLAFNIQEQAEKYGYTVFITNTNEDTDKMQLMINTLKSRQVDGFIIVPTENGSEHIAELIESGTPTVLLDRYFPELKSNHVLIDNYSAARNATNYLISKGLQKIALFTYKNTLHHFSERMRGYKDGLTEAGIFNSEYIKKINYSNIVEDTSKALDEVLNEGIDGILFATDSMCVAALKHIYTTKSDAFDKLSIISFDYSEIFDFSNYSIPYIEQPIPEMGRKAVDILIEQIEDKTPSENTKNIYFPTNILNAEL